MHAFEFIRPGGKQAIRPIYAVSGDDAYLRDEAIKVITRLALGGDTGGDEMALTRFPGEHAGLADVLDEVENADPFVTAHRKDLEAYAEKPSTAGVLILSVRTWPGSTRLAKLVDKSGLSIDCKTPDERELPGWLVAIAKGRFGAKLDEDALARLASAARLLVELVGPEIGLLASEVEKLYVFVGERNQIRRDDVARMVGAGRVETIWRTIEAATTGDGGEALADLDRLLGAGEPPIKLLAGMTFSLQKVHHAGQLRRSRIDLKDACQRAGIFSGAVEKTRQQHAHLGPGRVDALPGWLLQADLDMKGDSVLPPRVVLERLMIRLASKRKD